MMSCAGVGSEDSDAVGTRRSPVFANYSVGQLPKVPTYLGGEVGVVLASTVCVYRYFKIKSVPRRVAVARTLLGFYGVRV
jgi:hypothetical protein